MESLDFKKSVIKPLKVFLSDYVSNLQFNDAGHICILNQLNDILNSFYKIDNQIIHKIVEFKDRKEHISNGMCFTCGATGVYDIINSRCDKCIDNICNCSSCLKFIKFKK